MSFVGSTLGIHRVGAELGRGGMGTVYRATTLRDGPAGAAGAVVALKIFHSEQVADERAFARFEREADIGKEIHHPHLVRTYGIGSADVGGRTHHFMVMELVEGRTLKALLRELGVLPEALLFAVADQVLDALSTMHARGIVHRDVKPENVVLTPDHRAVLMDLGVASRLSRVDRQRAGEFTGSLAYAAPEQCAGEHVGPRADLYALGVMLLELATGRNPFAGLDTAAVMAKKLDEELPPPRTTSADLPPFWDGVIHACVRRQPTARFASAGELRRVLSEGEAGPWWRQRRGARSAPSADRALRRLRLPRRTPMLGRDAERARLAELQSQAASAGAVLLVSGATGMGKSRLVHEHLEAVASAGGPLLAAGRAVGAGGRGYGPFVEVLADLLGAEDDDGALNARLAALLPERGGVVAALAAFVRGTLLPGAESGFSKDALLGAVADVLRGLAAERPLVLVVDDLHLAGPETVELFGHLARCVPGQPILLIGAFDDEALETAEPLRAWLADEGAGAGRLALAPLATDAVDGIVRAFVRRERTVRSLAPTLRARGAGNPLLILEILAHLEATGVLVEREDGWHLAASLDEVAVPSTVRDLLALRLASLEDEERELLETAAVLGVSFQATLLAAVLEETPLELLGGLAVLERRHRLLESAGKDAFSFASPQLHDVVYAGIPESLRGEYHALVADVLLEADAESTGPPAFDLLRHLVLADRALEAEPFLESALEHVGARLRADEAARFLERLAAAFDGASARARLAIAMKLWAFHEMRGSRADEVRALVAAAALADELGEPGPRARVHALRAGTSWYAGDMVAAEAEARTGLELAREAGHRELEAMCLHTLGVVAFRRGEVRPCVERWREALEIRRAIQDRRGVASTLQALALVMRSIGEEERVLATMEEALGIWREIGERRGEAAILMNIGNHHVDGARYEEGLGYLERALAMHRDTGALVNEAIVLTNTGHALNFLGRIDEARGAWERALGIFVDHGNPNGELAVRTMLGGALAEHGEDEPAREHLEAAVLLAQRTGNRGKLALAHRALGQLLHDGGAREAGREHLEAALAIDRELGDATGRVLGLALLGRAALLEGDAAEATRALEEALPPAREIGALAPLVLARLARAKALLGHGERASELAREARERIEAAGGVSARDGPEILYLLHLVLAEPDLLARADALLRERAGAVRNDTYREYLLSRAWPGAAIREAVASAGPAAEAAGPA